MKEQVLKNWHSYVSTSDMELLDDLLADEVVFHSPVVHTPQEGKTLTKMYLTAAQHVFSKNDFTYVREVADDSNLVLEFTALIDGITINGIDMIRFDGAGKITDFKVMIRPLKAINMIHQQMMNMLSQLPK